MAVLVNLLKGWTGRDGRQAAAPERVGCKTAWAELLDDGVAPVRGELTYEPGAPRYDDADLILVEHLLSVEECARIVAAAESETFGTTPYPPQYRGNLRLITTDESLASAIWERLKPMVPSTVVDEKGETWDAYGVNECVRLARYSPGDRFLEHLDANFRRSDGDMSLFTVNAYLNEVVDGGATRFYGEAPKKRKGVVERPVTLAVAPGPGRAVVFRQPPGRYFYHDGEALGSGRKYLLRTDVMYRRRGPAP